MEDAKENGGYYYQYTFIDEYSRFRYLEAFKEKNTYTSTVFLRHVVEKFPYAIECIQTDNGFEFTNEMGNSKKKPLTLFEKTLAELGIQHKKIRPFTPRHNGKVERSHRKDNEEFYACHKFFSFEDFKKQLAVRQHQYNNFPMRPLGWKSPKHVLFSFPDVLHRREVKQSLLWGLPVERSHGEMVIGTLTDSQLFLKVLEGVKAM